MGPAKDKHGVRESNIFIREEWPFPDKGIFDQNQCLAMEVKGDGSSFNHSPCISDWGCLTIGYPVPSIGESVRFLSNVNNMGCKSANFGHRPNMRLLFARLYC